MRIHGATQRNHRPPVSQYTLGDDFAGFYAEFLTPLVGRETIRDGEPIVTLAKAGITAQRLRYLDLLLESPWTVPTARMGNCNHR